MKTIAYFTDSLFFSGCENMIANFLSSEKLQHQYDLKFFFNYSKVYDQELRRRVSAQQIQKHMIPIRGLNFFRNFLRAKNRWVRKTAILMESFVLRYPVLLCDIITLFFTFKKHKIDLLHINNGGFPGARSCQAAVIAGYLCGIKNIIYVVNNIAFSYRYSVRWLDWPIDQLIKNKVKLFITGSRYASSCLQQVLQLPSKRFAVLPNGIRMRDMHQAREPFLTSYQLPATGRVIVGVVAHLEARKGHIYLLEAMLKLKSKNEEMPILLIEGEGPDYETLLAFVQANHLEDSVRFLGKVSYVFDLLNAVDFVILPSISHEDFPNVVIEAMGLGKAVIGTQLAGIPEQIRHGETGLIVPPRDSNALAEAILDFVNNDDKRTTMGLKGQERFQALFTEEVAVLRYMSLYDRLIGYTPEGDQ